MRDSEREDLECFLELLGEIDPSACEFSDRPDLLVTEPDRIVGVELTRLYAEDPELRSGQQRRPQEKLHAAIADRAMEFFRQGLDVPLTVHFQFVEPFDSRKQNIEAEAAALSSAVLAVFNRLPDKTSTGPTVVFERWQLLRFGIAVPECIERIWLKVEANSDYEIWAPAYGYAVPSLTVHGLTEVILSKDARIDAYLDRCSAAWLLICTNIGTPASHHTVADEIRYAQFTTRFERVFLMDRSRRELVELQIAKDNDELPSTAPSN